MPRLYAAFTVRGQLRRDANGDPIVCARSQDVAKHPAFQKGDYAERVTVEAGEGGGWW